MANSGYDELFSFQAQAIGRIIVFVSYMNWGYLLTLALFSLLA